MRRHLACFINRQNLRPIRFPCNFRIILRFCRRDRQLQILRLSDAHFLCALNGYLLDCIAGNLNRTGDFSAVTQNFSDRRRARFLSCNHAGLFLNGYGITVTIPDAPVGVFVGTFTGACRLIFRFFSDIGRANSQLDLLTNLQCYCFRILRFQHNLRSHWSGNRRIIILRHGRRDCAADQHAAQQSAKQFRHFFHVVIISLRSPHQIFIQLYYTAQPCICHRIFAGIPNKFTICSHLRLNRQILILCSISRFLLRTASSNVIINISFIVS